MSLRIACDLDGTVADMDRALQREAERLFGPGVVLRAQTSPPDDDSEEQDGPSEVSEQGPESRRVLSPREVRALWSHVRKIENFWQTLDELEPGAVARLSSLASRHRWHVVFLTKRPQTRGDHAQVQSQRWLAEKGFPLPSVCVMSHSRGVLAGLLDLHAVIDDRPETCLDVAADSKAEPILVWREDFGSIPPGVTGLGVTAVATFQAALDRLEDRATAARTPGLLDRIKTALRSS
jgi:hypothetical protein